MCVCCISVIFLSFLLQLSFLRSLVFFTHIVLFCQHIFNHSFATQYIVVLLGHFKAPDTVLFHDMSFILSLFLHISKSYFSHLFSTLFQFQYKSVAQYNNYCLGLLKMILYSYSSTNCCPEKCLQSKINMISTQPSQMFLIYFGFAENAF